jgi:hypothetical protein
VQLLPFTICRLLARCSMPYALCLFAMRSAKSRSILMECIEVEVFASEGQFIVQAVGEKYLIEAGCAVFESYRGSFKKESPHADEGLIENLLHFFEIFIVIICPAVQSVSVMEPQVFHV